MVHRLGQNLLVAPVFILRRLAQAGVVVVALVLQVPEVVAVEAVEPLLEVYMTPPHYQPH